MNQLTLNSVFIILLNALCFLFQSNSLKAQDKDTSQIILPCWTFYQGDSIMGEANGEIQIISRPKMTIKLDHHKDFTILFRTTHHNISGLTAIINVSICYNTKIIAYSTRYSYEKTDSGYYVTRFSFKNDLLLNKLKNFKGKELKITFKDDTYQTTLGYLAVN